MNFHSRFDPAIAAAALSFAASTFAQGADSAQAVAPDAALVPAVTQDSGVKVVTAPGRYSNDPLVKMTRWWRTPHFVYRAEAKRLSEALQDFAASQGLPIVVAQGVDGVVQGNFDTTPEGFLNAMAKAFGIIWYHDGSALYIYPSSAIESRLFRLKGFSREQVETLLRSLQLGDSRYPLRFDTHENTLLVYGPPRHVDLVGAALESLDAGVTERNRKVLRVFPLKFSSASDRSYGESRVPGVATIMRQAYGAVPAPADAAPPASTGAEPSALGSKLQSVPGLNGNKALDAMLGKTQNTGANAQDEGKSSFGLGTRGLHSPVKDDAADATFQSDEGTNSVIVYGPEGRMSEYEDVVARLDVEPTLVEIEATIIDVDSNSYDSLGVNWSATGTHGSVSVTSPAVSGTATDGSLSSGVFGISTLWQNAGYALLAKVEALSSQGKAKVIAKPKVLGVANRAATMGNKRISSVRVAGNLEANLFQVEAGTLLKVTPQVIESPTSQVKLSIYIQDGDFEQTSVDQIPIVRRTEIATEVRMVEGESVLIGGITSDSDTTQVSGVPLLSRIPLLGGLFRWNGGNASHTERLFLITPRIVHDVTRLPVAAPADPGVPSTVGPATGSGEPSPRIVGPVSRLGASAPATSPVPAKPATVPASVHAPANPARDSNVHREAPAEPFTSEPAADPLPARTENVS